MPCSQPLFPFRGQPEGGRTDAVSYLGMTGAP